MAILLAAGITATASVSRAAVSRDYSAPTVQRCLTAKGEFVTYAQAPKSWFQAFNLKHIPDGLTARVGMIGPGETPGGKFAIDKGVLFFFRTPLSAQRGEAELVADFIFGHGVTGIERIAIALQMPPNGRVAKTLHRVIGNIVVIWWGPRREHPRASDRNLALCLR
jgi:hypothetical protein